MSIPQPEPKKQSKLKRWHKIAIGVVVLVLVAVVAVPFVYINFIKDDPKAAIGDASTATFPQDTGTVAPTVDVTDPSTTVASPADTDAASTSTSVEATAAPSESSADGTYTITTDSVVGYRVVEILFGQDTEGVGRTNSVTGAVTVSGTQVTAAEFVVDMASVKSDEDRRDNQFRGRLLETDTFPTATFTITEPIELGSIPADDETISATATGDLTLHGVTKSVTMEVTAKRSGKNLAVNGSTDIKFADYDIEDPSTNGISVQDHGTLEFALIATA